MVALLHGEPQNIPFGKSEQDPVLRERLEKFKQKVMMGRLVKFWKAIEELPGLVALSLSKTIKAYPAVGWVRGGGVPNEGLLLELNELRKQNADLQDSLRRASDADRSPVAGIASIDSAYTFHGTRSVMNNGRSSKYDFQCKISWKDLFALLAPYLEEHPNENFVQSRLARALLERVSKEGYSVSIADQEFKTARIQLEAYGLIQTRYLETTKGGMSLFWSLTDRGRRLMVETRVVREKA